MLHIERKETHLFMRLFSFVIIKGVGYSGENQNNSNCSPNNFILKYSWIYYNVSYETI